MRRSAQQGKSGGYGATGKKTFFFFFSSRRRHTRCREVSWARRCVQETGTWEDFETGWKLFSGEEVFKGKILEFESRYDFNAAIVDKYCLLYTSDAADDTPCVDLGGRRIIKKKKKETT
eukprot:TRINITY_DN1256_c0_g1_i7.p2 TRINITY_DN1256_c0_g1~~TRINITY_DN1256_c0_g1_i7.p2  ORF type:complete len:119 (+),score=58.67 TRINITY_DN1256_c0_g1_i7:43-399(+)